MTPTSALVYADGGIDLVADGEIVDFIPARTGLTTSELLATRGLTGEPHEVGTDILGRPAGESVDTEAGPAGVWTVEAIA